MEITDKKLKSDLGEEKKKELPVKIVIDRISEQEYTIQVSYHSKSSLQRQIRELILTTPLRLEIENIKNKKGQMPSVENFKKLTKQNKELQGYFKDRSDKKEFKEVL